ncbi:hypothetical protein TTHERM_00532160 (macronuclear) [Tetrahymena thermophila SB210]|uniref:Uncharacterized protein n=1 Tax=Tetrahymena thermophila (strain SB210) TaxID=312017 RepID=Q248F1_TETTS|nr:hypothetical protein TTHERM_00532160 [Tetrahymena thermophila SB210]EAS04094.2 hypothetical protein TTHERM_00532160 [Tetrahymena thermophila SB210]|eukprot:XP_001024339.2 hypothetical protein TTHERM_00532160 [Tetrahymena thermophila SB210]
MCFQSDATCQTIFQMRRQLNNKYNQLIYHRPINQNTLQFPLQSQNQKNDNLEFNCSKLDYQIQENTQEINEQINKQKSENSISLNKINSSTLKKNNTDNQNLHKYFEFLLNKPSKVDIPKIKQLNEINFLLDKKIQQNNEKIKSEPLSQRQKCLEKLKHQYRSMQANQQQSQKYSRKISYQDYQNNFIESPEPLKLKKGYSESQESVNLKCESPLTAKLEQTLEQNIEPKTISSIRKLSQNILLNNQPIKNIKEKRSKQQIIISQDTTQDFADIVIKKHEIRERKKEEVGELAKYDFSAINRSPCKLKKYASVKIDMKQQRFENIMNNQSIQKQFQDIQNLINHSSARINKIKNNKQQL